MTEKTKLTVIKTETPFARIEPGTAEPMAFTPRPAEEAETLNWIKGLKQGDKVAMVSPGTLYPQIAVVAKVWDELPTIETMYGALPPGAMMGPTPPFPDFSKSKLPIVQCAGFAFFDRTRKVILFGDAMTDMQLEGITFRPFTENMATLRQKRDLVVLLKDFAWAELPMEALLQINGIIREAFGQ